MIDLGPAGWMFGTYLALILLMVGIEGLCVALMQWWDPRR